MTVINPVSSLSLTVPETRLDNWLALGCSLKFTPICGGNNGKPTNTRVKWDYEIVGFDLDQKKQITLSTEKQKFIKENGYFFRLSEGCIEADSNEVYAERVSELYDKQKCDNYAIIVKATTTDGSNITTTKLVKSVRNNPYMITDKKQYDIYIGGSNIDPIKLETPYEYKGVYVSIANPELLTYKLYPNRMIWLFGQKKGSTDVTFTMMDGSGLSQKIKVTVKERGKRK